MSDVDQPEPTSRHSTPTQTGSPAPEEDSERSGNEAFSRKSIEPEPEPEPGEEDASVDSPLPRTEREEEGEGEGEHVEGSTNDIAEAVNKPLQPNEEEPKQELPSVAQVEKPAVKPKSKARPRSRTPLPLPLSAPITIRLDIALGGPSNYSINILSLAKETGQRPPTPPLRRRDSVSGSEEEEEEDEKGMPKDLPPPPTMTPNNDAPTEVDGPVKPRRRRRRADPENEFYDLNDPFIDDSDLGVDAPTHFAQTKQKGFYVNSGDVTLVLDSESKPGRRKKSGLPSSSSKLPSFLTAKRPGFKDPSRPTIHGLTSKPVSTSQAPDESLFPPHGPPTRDSVARSDVDSSLNDPTGGGTTAREQPPRFGGNGTEDNPIALDDQDTPDTYSGSIQSSSKRMKMENGNSVNISTLQTSSSVHMGHDQSHSSDSASKKRKRMSSGDPLHEFSLVMKEEFQNLHILVSNESFAVKTKFPQTLRAPLAEVALKAVELDEYGENFFKYLTEIFPYNKFTMTKLVKRLIYDRHVKILNDRIDGLLDELKIIAVEGFPAAQQAHKDEVARWEEKQEKKRIKAESEGASGGPPEASAPPNQDDGNNAAPTRRERDTARPVQRYRWTDPIKSCVWQMVSLNNELASMANVMHEFEPDNHPLVSDQSMRKTLYQRIVAMFPEGWMTSGLISRETSNMKKKVQMAEQDEDVSD